MNDGAIDPRHKLGVVEEVPGLNFVGLHFQRSFTSHLVTGVGRDAKFIAGEIARRSVVQYSVEEGVSDGKSKAYG